MISIKEVKTLPELEQVQQLEKSIWKTPPIPTHQTLTAIKNGGIIVGAYDGEKIVGFSYGFAGFKDGKAYVCSHMLGIDEAYRSQQIGERLKQAQREIAIAKGYEEMHWTFDPLETRNGYLNLTKLNGICDTYIENCYGEMEDGFNKGLPSDRFEIHWHLNADYVTKQHEPNIENPVALGEIKWNEAQLPSLKAYEIQELDAECYALPVPQDFQQLKSVSQELAMHWRLEVRKACQNLFAAGYTAVRLQKQPNYNEYLFVRKTTLSLGGNKA